MKSAARPQDPRPVLRVLLCAPRGFCAGVVRAIESVERALRVFGAPVYVRHAIVHNKYVIESLKAKGAVFVDELDEIPDGDAPVIFSAHGVAKAVVEEARRRRFRTIDATCPLVTKVHREAEAHFRRGFEVVLVGHRGHPEVVGTAGRLPKDAVTVVESLAEVDGFVPTDASRLAYVTQTTLSVDDAGAIVAALKRRFPAIRGPNRADICYATTNRQEAVKTVARQVEAMIVVGSPNSSNSRRLAEVASSAGCPHAALLERADTIDWSQFLGLKTLGLTAGASAPEALVIEVLDAFAERYDIVAETVAVANESVLFALPPAFSSAERRVAATA